MARDFAKPFYKSRQWQRCREVYIKKAGGLCEDCLAKGIYTAGEEVHHEIELTPANIHDPNITLNADNLVLLCHNCHTKRHAKKQRRWTVDAQGRVTT